MTPRKRSARAHTYHLHFTDGLDLYIAVRKPLSVILSQFRRGAITQELNTYEPDTRGESETLLIDWSKVSYVTDEGEE